MTQYLTAHFKVTFFISAILMSGHSFAKQASFYCNGDISIASGDTNNLDILNLNSEGFDLESHKHEVVRASLDGKNNFIKIQPFQKMKWSRVNEVEEFPSRFKFTTDKKTWFAIEAAMESDDVVRHLFCQRDN